MSTTMLPPATTGQESLTITVPDHPGALVEESTATPMATPAPAPPAEVMANPIPWVIAAVAVVMWLIGFALGIIAVGIPVERAAFEGWAPTEYGLAMEHLAQAPLTAGAEVGLAMEHLAQVPANPAAISLAQEHLAQAPTPSAYGLEHEHLAQAP